MSGTIEKARAVLAQLEQTVDVPRDETAAALRELIALAEGLFEDLDDYNTRIARAAKAIGATGCPVDQLNAVVRYTERGRRRAVCGYVSAGDELVVFISRPNRILLETDPLKAEFDEMLSDVCPGFLTRAPGGGGGARP